MVYSYQLFNIEQNMTSDLLVSYRGASLGILSHPGILPRDFDGSRIMKNGDLTIKL